MSKQDDSKFDAAKAELFEAVGHPNRIKIIQALDQGAMGFAELKKRVGMESSGHLAFHLGKLDHLVALNPDGRYVLTGEGKEALRMIQTVKEHGPRRESWVSPLPRRSVVAALLALLIAFAAVAAFQQLEIVSMSAKPPGTVTLNGRAFWYSVIPSRELPADRNTSVLVNGVNFTLVPANSFGIGWALTTNVGYSTCITNSSKYTISSFGANNASEVRVVRLTCLLYQNVLVRFADGKTEVMFVDSSAVGFAFPSFPWFSNHQGPQVAVSENYTAVTLYVSAGR